MFALPDDLWMCFLSFLGCNIEFLPLIKMECIDFFNFTIFDTSTSGYFFQISVSLEGGDWVFLELFPSIFVDLEDVWVSASNGCKVR